MDIKKIIKQLPTGFVEEAAGLDEAGLQEVILGSTANLAQVDKEQQADQKLNGAREIVKDIMGGYNDAKKAQKAKIAYALHLLAEKGSPVVGDLSSEDPT